MLVNNYVVYLPHGDGDALGFERKAYLLSTSGYDIDFVQYIASGSRFFALISSFLYVVVGRPFYWSKHFVFDQIILDRSFVLANHFAVNELKFLEVFFIFL